MGGEGLQARAACRRIVPYGRVTETMLFLSITNTTGKLL